MSSDLKSDPGELRLQVVITRKATGAVETYELIGTPILEKEQENGSNTLNSSTQRSN